MRELQPNDVMNWKFTCWGVGKDKKNIIHFPDIASSQSLRKVTLRLLSRQCVCGGGMGGEGDRERIESIWGL